MSDVVKQVGGDHYQAPWGWQHWDLCEQFQTGYLEGCATAYVLRFDRKGTPRQDLEKAISYLERLLRSKRDVRGPWTIGEFLEFCRVNHCSAEKVNILQLVLVYGTVTTLHVAVTRIRELFP